MRTRGRNKALENIFENDIVSRILDRVKFSLGSALGVLSCFGILQFADTMYACDQIGQFMKVLVNKFAFKSIQKDWLLWGYLEIDQ